MYRISLKARGIERIFLVVHLLGGNPGFAGQLQFALLREVINGVAVDVVFFVVNSILAVHLGQFAVDPAIEDKAVTLSEKFGRIADSGVDGVGIFLRRDDLQGGDHADICQGRERCVGDIFFFGIIPKKGGVTYACLGACRFEKHVAFAVEIQIGEKEAVAVVVKFGEKLIGHALSGIRADALPVAFHLDPFHAPVSVKRVGHVLEDKTIQLGHAAGGEGGGEQKCRCEAGEYAGFYRERFHLEFLTKGRLLGILI